MGFDKREMIEKLKLEITIIERGGYNPSVREPRRELRTFRDSLTCLNVGLEKKQIPCSECFLIEYVPAEYRNKEEPCHYIPLNEQGDTVASLKGDHDKLKRELLRWLYRTVAELQTEVTQGR